MNKQFKCILIAVLALVLCFALAVCVACDGISPDWSSDETGHWHADKDGKKVDFAAHQYTDDADTTCDVCGYTRTITPPAHEHSWASEWTKDATNHWHVCAGCNETKDVAAHQYTDDADTTCDVCGYERTVTPPAHEHSWASEWTTDENNHWHVCAGCDELNSVGAHQYADDTDATCDVCGYERQVAPVGEYETITTTCDIAALWQTYGEGSKITEAVTQGKFTFSAGLYFNEKTGDLTGCVVNTQKKDIIITVSGADNQNTISLDAKNASSTYGKLLLLDENGNTVFDFGTIDSVRLGLKAENLPAGTYTLKSEQSIRIGNLSVTEKLPKSAPTGITVSGAPEKDLAGRTFSSQGLVVTLNYANGRKDTVTTGYTVDSSNVDMNTSGVYTVTVRYKADGVDEEFSTTYNISIYAVESVELSDHSIDTKRVTHPVQKVFAVGETFNHNYLAVAAIAKAPGSDTAERFVLKDGEYTISGAEDINVAGTKTITVTVGNTSAQYNVYYVQATGTLSEVVVSTTVDGVTTESGTYTVSSVNLAIQLYKAFNLDQNDVKTIRVREGEYKEKVEIDLPNVRLIGEGNAVLWCDVLAGQVDPSGTGSYSTDGSASVSIRASAVGFYAENITFKNYYNTHALYTASKALMSDTQAVACLVQADQSYFKNCTFTSYHDTLFAMDGRQVYDSCHIEGRTDYIFGYAATCLFKNCTIKSLYGNDNKNGGYVVATKGTQGLLYGYIFDGCTLTAEDEVVAGTISLARGWDDYMTIAYINCSISDKFSLEAIGEKTMVDDGTGNLVEAKDNKNDRYTNMNKPSHPEQLFEYNNTGAGALTAEMLAKADANGLIANVCTVLTAEQAAQFTNPAVIFAKLQQRQGATDFATSYISDWDGTSGSKITTKTLDFAIFEQGYTGVTVQEHFADELTYSIPDTITKSALRWNGNSIQVDIGSTITLKTAGTIAVEWYGHPYGSAANGIVTYKDGFASIQIVNCPGCSGVYIKSITIDSDNIPADTVWYDVTFDYNYAGAPEATVVKAAGGNMVVAVAQPTREEYNFVGWFLGDTEYNFNTLVSGNITLVAHWEEVTDYTITEDITYWFTGDQAYSGTVVAGEVVKYQKLIINGGANGSLVQHDGSWYKLLGDATLTLTLKAGATVTIVTYDEAIAINGVKVDAANYTAENDGKHYVHTATADGDVVISLAEGCNQLYLKAIIVETTDAMLVPVEANTTYKYDGTANSTANFALRNCADNSDWLKFGTNGSITFFAKAGATISIVGSPYDSADAVLYLNGEEMAKDSGNVWTGTVEADGKVVVANSGTVYIKSLAVVYPVVDPDADVLKVGKSVTFGTEGNHSELVATGKLVVTGGNVRDNGGNNSETSGMTLAIKVKAGTVVVINGYPSYTNYTVQIGESVVSGEAAVTDAEWKYTVEADCTLSIICGSNCYFYSIVAEEATSVTPDRKTVQVFFGADSAGTEINNGKPITDNELFSASDAKKTVITKDAVTATANDGTGLTFDYALLPTGQAAILTINAKVAITVTVYVTVSDSNFNQKASSKSGVVTWTINGETFTETNAETKANAVAYAITFTLNAGETATVQSNANRLVVFGIVATEQ